MASYPTIKEYKPAVKSPTRFKTLKLTPVMRHGNEPHFASGRLATVFKMEDTNVTGRMVALKCFRVPQKEREERYEAVSARLNQLMGQGGERYFVKYQFLADEINVDTSCVPGGKGWFPVLAMEWIEGDTLSTYLKKACGRKDTDAIKEILDRWDPLYKFLQDSQIGHGDLQHGNIIVTPSKELKLIDYDGMYVEALKGKKALEAGVPSYQSLWRTPKEFSPEIDYFPALIIRTSLLALMLDPALWKYHDDENLIFSKKDFLKPKKSPLFQRLKDMRDPSLLLLLDEIIESIKSKQIGPMSAAGAFASPATSGTTTASSPSTQPPPVSPRSGNSYLIFILDQETQAYFQTREAITNLLKEVHTKRFSYDIILYGAATTYVAPTKDSSASISKLFLEASRMQTFFEAVEMTEAKVKDWTQAYPNASPPLILHLGQRDTLSVDISGVLQHSVNGETSRFFNVLGIRESFYRSVEFPAIPAPLEPQHQGWFSISTEIPLSIANFLLQSYAILAGGGKGLLINPPASLITQFFYGCVKAIL